MSYTYTTNFGGGVILAPCLATLCGEVARSPKYRVLTNLGELGDATHASQGTSSDHNPFVVHGGRRYVRAVDFGGDQRLLRELRAELFAIYRRHDPRIYPYGYGKGPDSLIFDWPPGTGMHVDTGDEGHLHVSVGIANPGDPNGWIPALDSTAPWGIGGASTSTEDDLTPEQAKQLAAIHAALGDIGAAAADDNVFALIPRFLRFADSVGKQLAAIQAEVDAIKVKVQA